MGLKAEGRVEVELGYDNERLGLAYGWLGGKSNKKNILVIDGIFVNIWIEIIYVLELYAKGKYIDYCWLFTNFIKIIIVWYFGFL